MKKSLISISLLIGLSNIANAAQFQKPDVEFISNAANHSITVDNWDQGENAASTFPNAYKFTNSYRLSHGLLGSDSDVISPQELQQGKSIDLNKIMVSDIDGEMSVESFLRDRVKNHSMVVVQGEKLIHQHFWNNTSPETTHLDMSVTKSFTSMLAAIATAEGKLDMSKKVIDYLPELKGTAWETATVQEVADMRTSLIFPQQKGKTWDDRMTASQGYNGDQSKTYPNGVADYFPLVKDYEGDMGHKYTYQCVNTEVLGKVVEAATGKNLADLYESQIWQKVGLEHDAFLMSDPSGFPMASGGLNATTRDIARVGLMIQNGGKNYLGDQVIPTEFIQNLWKGNEEVRSAWKLSKEAPLANGWYKDQFRVLEIPGHTILAMVGIHGQVVAMDKDSGTVIAMNGGYPKTETPRMAISLFNKVIPAILDAVKK